MDRLTIGVAVLLFGVGFAMAAAVECPTPVKASVAKAYPGSTITGCKQETEKGAVQFEVKLSTKDGKPLEADVAPDGAILQTEEQIAPQKLPAVVLDTFKARYGESKVGKAEKIVKAGGAIEYEIAFTRGGAKMEVTISHEGKVLEEESPEKPTPTK